MLADISNVDAIYLVCGRTDMRKSIDGLCAIIQEQFSMEIDHALYLFCGRKCDRIKAILKEPDGIVMIYKRLTVQGSYRWPRDKSEVRNLTWREFGWLMSGIDIEQPKAIRTSYQATVDAANKREEALIQERDNLKDEICLLRKKLFGSSSEKRVIDFPGQLNLFNEGELEQDSSAAETEELAATLPEESPKKRKTRATDVKKYIDIPEEDKTCPVCNTPLVKIGEEFVRRELVFIPAN